MARLIDADALIKVFQHKLENNIFPLCVISTIEDAPTIEAEAVMHGKWEFNGAMTEKHCSECYQKCDDDEYEFCPHCGAKMDGE